MAGVGAKAALRKELKAVLRSISAEARAEQSALVAARVLALPQYREAASVALYLSLPAEVDTAAIVTAVLASNKKCYIPRWAKKDRTAAPSCAMCRYYSGGRKMDMVLVRDAADLASLPVTSWGIRSAGSFSAVDTQCRQPGEEEKREEALGAGAPDLLLVPGLAFTGQGARCSAVKCSALLCDLEIQLKPESEISGPGHSEVAESLVC
jgi:5-formyltetrahydrofolate cyclo-ligase